MPKEKKARLPDAPPALKLGEYRYRQSDLESVSVTVYSAADDQKQRVLVNGCLIY